jgi:hypothetical protein
MARELPRTLQSLARPYQRDIETLDYEVIVVDNGSCKPARTDDLTQFGLNLRMLSCDVKSPSPVAALNMGLEACQADNIGVLIDGARMASPRLLAAADRALAMHPRAIVFTQSLALGHAPQWQSAQTGYNQAVEDALLADIDWIHNGYRLFEISSWETESRAITRWMDPRFESNALFMSRALWDETEGYELGFQTAGGGCASHDLFDRACALPETQLIHILGEATFHQFHSDSASTAHVDVGNQIKRFAREFSRVRQKPLCQITKPAWMVQLAPLSDIAPVAPPQNPLPDDRYVGLLKQVILNETAIALEAKLDLMIAAGGTEPSGAVLESAEKRLRKHRHDGQWQGRLPESLSMIGRKRLDHLGQSVETILAEKIPGDLMECGVWRGGACILMAGILAARNITDRRLWLADPFAGFPATTSVARQDESGESWDQFTAKYPKVAVSQEEVAANLARFDLLGPHIRFLKGWFSDTLPTAPVERLALLRLDGDTFGATTQALQSLYDKVSAGGFIIVDDYAIPECRAAVKAFRGSQGITNEVQRIDWTGVFWRKGSTK